MGIIIVKLNRVLVLALCVFYTNVFAAELMSASEYKQEVTRLLKGYLKMREAGVFLDNNEIRLLGSDIEFLYPKEARNGAPAGMFFSRPPGSTWLEQVQQLSQAKVKGELLPPCFPLPPNMYESVMCGPELIVLYMATTGEQEIVLQDAVIAKMWLALLCDDQPDACDLKSDAEIEAELDALFK